MNFQGKAIGDLIHESYSNFDANEDITFFSRVHFFNFDHYNVFVEETGVHFNVIFNWNTIEKLRTFLDYFGAPLRVT